MDYNFNDVDGSKNWVKVKKIDYGWSCDEKYYIEDDKSKKYLLRVCTRDSYKQKQKEVEVIKKFNNLDFEMSRVIDFGYFNECRNVYMLLSWVEGSSLEEKVDSLPEVEQYELGVQAGRILKAIHSIPVDREDIALVNKIPKKLLQLQRYENSSLRIPNDEIAIDFIKNNIHMMCRLYPVYEHGDFHMGNLIYTPDRNIGVIDFNRWECGDRYEEFYKVQSFDIENSIAFSVGQIQGYFKGDPPIDFWKTQAVYVAHSSLYSIKWAEKFGQEQVYEMKKRCFQAFRDYDDFNLTIPKWYSQNKDKYRL
ncbi:aminoglycoside phosphotransferase family protein [Clostridium ljungdahlii]|uniref:Phosphotransferase enzyme family protein n=1 Tax=Clostridium ljungdahlii TaxID=1538 RepID=A0A168LX00_9CLOT|nr:phosphotransferase [Clostridium ljungdahlii]OAA83814.1 Phosphotransferase enzyme family protein [Clostridium ljungdahlii]